MGKREPVCALVQMATATGKDTGGFLIVTYYSTKITLIDGQKLN